MMKTPLTLVSVIERAETYFPKKQVISRTSSGVHRLTYTEIGQRTRALSSALEKLGVGRGDRVGTLAWNDHRHLEAYFAAPCMGAVVHMINPCLSQDHLGYIINHAEDKVLLIDESFVSLVEAIQDQLTTVEAFVMMTEKEKLQPTSLSPVYSYEDLIGKGDANYAFAEDLDENEPCGMCYTSATTGKPKGVVYTHRSNVLHSMNLGLADTLGLSETDVSMPVMSMFHVNALGFPYASTFFGTTQVLPGPNFTPQLLAELIESEKVTVTVGVPTIWIGLAKELEHGNYDTSSLRAVFCGGAPTPKRLIRTYEEKFNIPLVHVYGLTETSPVVSVTRLKSYQQALPNEEQLEIRATQGIIAPGLEAKLVDDHGEVAHNGKEMGELLLRGPWIADEYYKDNRHKDAFKDGWFCTGDIATMDEEGYFKIVDRKKDLIKSGGEWISSVDLENALMANEAVFEAAVIAVSHPKWQERPVACVVLKEDYRDKVTKEDLLEDLRSQFVKWWLPDDVIFMDKIPRTPVDKFLKRQLREQLKDHLLSE
ncbi:MAG TPA: long-chain fatty acid--CoA ligase [Bacillales bacterium]|nr:long-chain fatty acid--CoA ligase [Bacillales bacterium]